MGHWFTKNEYYDVITNVYTIPPPDDHKFQTLFWDNVDNQIKQQEDCWNDKGLIFLFVKAKSDSANSVIEVAIRKNKDKWLFCDERHEINEVIKEIGTCKSK